MYFVIGGICSFVAYVLIGIFRWNPSEVSKFDGEHFIPDFFFKIGVAGVTLIGWPVIIPTFGLYFVAEKIIRKFQVPKPEPVKNAQSSRRF